MSYLFLSVIKTPVAGVDNTKVSFFIGRSVLSLGFTFFIGIFGNTKGVCITGGKDHLCCTSFVSLVKHLSAGNRCRVMQKRMFRIELSFVEIQDIHYL